MMTLSNCTVKLAISNNGHKILDRHTLYLKYLQPQLLQKGNLTENGFSTFGEITSEV